MAAKFAVLPPISTAWINKDGTPTNAFLKFMTGIANNNTGPYPSATDDDAASKANVPLNAVYESNGLLRVRKN